MSDAVHNTVSSFTDAVGNTRGSISNALSSGLSNAFSGFFHNTVSSVADAAKNTVGSVADVAKNTVSSIQDNPLAAAALIAAGWYFAPEIGAWMNSATGEAIAGTAEGANAGAVATPIASGSVAATDLGTLGSTGTGLTAGGTGLGLTLPSQTTGLGLTAPDTVAGLTGAGAAYGAGSMLPADIAAAGAGSALGSAAGAAGGAAAGSSLSSMLPYMAGGQIVTGLLQAKAAKDAADIQSAAAQGATQLQGQMFNTINKQQAPYRTAGYQALNQIGSLGSGQYVKYDANGNPIGTDTGNDYLTHQFNAADLKAGLAPNYDFMLQQGQMANQRAANAAGGGLSGNALQGLNKFTQDYAGNAYQNAFSNYQNQRSNIYNTLAGIAGIGQTGQTQTNQAGTNATNAASQLGVGSAAAQAAGMTGQTNALANTVGNVANTYMLANLLGQRGSVA